ncbi:hypothetical protein CDIK_1129 [Cucumispora dikerogammari]|nr:hypothetical protein CDIK_1129 [Cucumispora dikerogammari]
MLAFIDNLKLIGCSNTEKNPKPQKIIKKPYIATMIHENNDSEISSDLWPISIKGNYNILFSDRRSQIEICVYLDVVLDNQYFFVSEDSVYFTRYTKGDTNADEIVGKGDKFDIKTYTTIEDGEPYSDYKPKEGETLISKKITMVFRNESSIGDYTRKKSMFAFMDFLQIRGSEIKNTIFTFNFVFMLKNKITKESVKITAQTKFFQFTFQDEDVRGHGKERMSLKRKVAFN